MAVIGGTEYQQLLQAIESYYGAGSDQWMQVAQYGTNAPDFIKITKQLPNYNTVVSPSGRVLGYERFDSINTSSVASQINSNVQSGAYSAVKVRTPASTGTDSVTGNVTASKGISTSSGMQFITKSVVPAIMAAGVGISLGKTIDRALYNANPDFWNAHGMSQLNPDTWANITADMGDTLGEQALATAFNMLYGIDPNTNKSQAYLDETAFAYLALYEQTQGFFGGDMTAVIDDGNSLNFPEYTSYSLSGSPSIQVTYTPTGYGRDYKATVGTHTSPVYGVDANQVGINYKQVMFVSDAPFQVNELYDSTPVTQNARSTTRLGKTVYWYTTGIYSNDEHTSVTSNVPYTPNRQGNSASTAWDVMYIIDNGTVGRSNIAGVGDQTGATIPQLDNDMSVADALNALKTQYPELWQNAVEYPVLQPDGTTTTYVYVPVALPDATGATDTQPTGDGQYINQVTSAYDPSTMPDTVWDFLERIILDTTERDDQRETDDTGDGDTPTPVMPTGSASALWKIYSPSQAQLDAFGAWLWSSDFVDQIMKLFNDPMQAIIGLHKVFVTPPVSGSGAIKVGYLTSSASANYVNGQYVDVDCGTVTLEEYFGNVFDYENTQVEIYLPFSGIHKLNIDDVMRGNINVKYHVDVLTGACLIEVSVIRDTVGGVLYTFSGNCAVQYPVSSGSYVGIITGLLGIAGGVAGSIATGGALAPMLMGAGASIGRMHTDVQHSGNISSNAGAMGIKKPYLIIERSQAKTPKNAVNIEGLPQDSVTRLNDKHGYIRVKKAHYDGIPCTVSELEKIKALLENGVYIP